MGVGGQVRGSGVEEEEEEEEEVEEQREREGIEREEDVKSRFRSERLGKWRRRCERIVASVPKKKVVFVGKRSTHRCCKVP